MILHILSSYIVVYILVYSSTEAVVDPSTGPEMTEETVARKKVAAYGSWESRISSDVAVTAANKIIEPPRVDRVTGHVFWVEEISSEDGHGVLFQFDVETQKIVRWTGAAVDVRTRVHEYGGGSFLAYNNSVFYVSGDDNQVYRLQEPMGKPDKITDSPSKRYADFTYSPKRERLYCVFEDHGPVETGSSKEAKNGIAVLDLRSGTEDVLVSHSDFGASPRVTQDGTRLVWIQWDHPQMPWDETKLCAGTLSEDIASNITVDIDIQRGSMMTPNWNQFNELLYVSDQSGWWNLYLLSANGTERNLTPRQAETGWPSWMLGTQAFDSNPTVGAREVAVIQGKELLVVDTQTGASRVLDTGYTVYRSGLAFSNDGKQIYTVAGDGHRPLSVVEVDVETGSARALNERPLPVSDEHISVSAPVRFPTTDDMFAYGHLYLPKNPNYEAPHNSLPPLLVRTHGGPTSSAKTELNFNFQFFTSRGFAILDVDYRGSTGYGTAFRNLLKGKWGVYDVADAVAGARHLIQAGVVDPERIFIDGESAGGYTTICALTFTTAFTAGASFFGVSDLGSLAQSTHKFESLYLLGLVGSEAEYSARSGYHHAQRVATPIIFFQGTEDKIVPVDQAESMYNIVKKNKVPTAFVLYQGEGHGFVKEPTLKHALETELFFFSRVGNITLANITSDVVIDNLQA